jgi:hypothetical protein
MLVCHCYGIGSARVVFITTKVPDTFYASLMRIVAVVAMRIMTVIVVAV